VADDRLAAELRALADRLDVGPAPDVRAAVRARLEAPTVDRRRPAWRRPARPAARRWLAAAAAAVVLAVAVLVIPPARAAVASAVTGILRFAGVEIHRTPHGAPPTLPPTPSPLPSIRSAALDQARRVARFPVGVPVSLGAPEQVQLADPGPDGAPRVVTLLYRGGTLRLDEFDGTLDVAFSKQIDDPGMKFVDIGQDYGIWLSRSHPVEYVDRYGVRHTETARLAGPTLVWARASVTYRLEGAGSLDDALAIARSISTR
jgi:hypothetical protein